MDNPDLDLIVDPTQLTETLRVFAERAAFLDRSVRDLLLALSEEWHALSPTMDAQQLEAAVIRLHHAIDRPVPSHEKSTIASPLMPDRTERPRAAYRAAGRRDRWLTVAQVADIYRAASALPQLYGVMFNAWLTYRSGATGGSAVGVGARAVGALLAGLGKALTGRKSSSARTLHRIAWLEDDDGHLVVGVVFHLPESEEGHVRRWLDRRTAATGRESLSLDVRHPAARREKTARHWKLVRKIWAGTDPAARVGDQTLLDILGVPAGERHAFGDIAGRRFMLSESIGPGVARRHLRPLSAFDDRAWERLFDGWEWAEFDDRQAQETDRRQRQAEIDAILPSGGSELAQLRRDSALRALSESMPYDARDLPRNWPIWW